MQEWKSERATLCIKGITVMFVIVQAWNLQIYLREESPCLLKEKERVEF
jgi:hypothetical protein